MQPANAATLATGVHHPDRAAVRAAFPSNRAVQISVVKITPAMREERQRRADADSARRAAVRAADAEDRAAGLYVPSGAEREYLAAGLSPSAIAARTCFVDGDNTDDAARLEQHVSDIAAYVARRQQVGAPLADDATLAP